MSSPLLQPIVDKVRIEKSRYSTLPQHISTLAAKFDHIYKVTIIPQKSPTATGLIQTNILAPTSFGTGKIFLENTGRVPFKAPAANENDLRPIVFYAFGQGTHKFRVNLARDRSIYVETTVTFD